MVAQAKVKTREQVIEEGRERFNARKQIEQQRMAEQHAQEADRAVFAQRVQAARDAEAAFMHRSLAQRPEPRNAAEAAQIEAEARAAMAEVLPRPTPPNWNSIFEDKRTAELEEALRLEQERLAALTERDNIIAALPYATQQEITAYEKLRGVPYPLVALTMR